MRRKSCNLLECVVIVGCGRRTLRRTIQRSHSNTADDVLEGRGAGGSTGDNCVRQVSCSSSSSSSSSRSSRLQVVYYTTQTDDNDDDDVVTASSSSASVSAASQRAGGYRPVGDQPCLIIHNRTRLALARRDRSGRPLVVVIIRLD